MSIIYDALKKIEKAGSGTQGVISEKQKTSLRIIASLFLLVAILGAFAANKFFDFISKSERKSLLSGKAALLSPVKTQVSLPVQAQVSLPVGAKVTSSAVLPIVKLAGPLAVSGTPPKLPEEVKKVQPPELTLSGIVHSSDSSFALINNRVVKIGDKVSGATVMKISENEVELKINDLKFKLSLTAKSSY